MFEGVILAGGLSSRMGSDKAVLSYNGHRLIDHMQNLLMQCSLSPIRTSGAGGTPDSVPHCGPVGGLCTMIASSQNTAGWLFVPVDMPLLQPAFLRRLMLDGTVSDVVCFENTSLPLLIHHSLEVMKHVAETTEALHKGANFSVRAFLQPLTRTNLAVRADEEKQLANINTPEEWRQLMGHHHVSAP